MLMSYSLDNGLTRHGMDDLAYRHLNHSTIKFKDIVGSGKKQITFNQKIAFGVCIITLCYPILKHYECFIVVPCLFFIINNFKTKLKFILLILMFGLHDKYSFFLILIITFAYETYLINKKVLT